MVLKLEHFIGTKNGITILRYLTLNSYLSFGLTELSENVNISKSNVLRILNILKNENIVVEQKSGKKKLIRINNESELVKLFWKLFMVEKKNFLSPEFKNIIDLFFKKVKNNVNIFILFGSVAHGLATEKSDIDILVVGDEKLSGPLLDYLPYRFEIHNYSWQDLEEKKDFVVLEALMNGITYQGDIYPLIKDLKSFPKAYLIYRLNKVKDFLNKTKKLQGNSKKYYQKLADVTLGEIESLLKKKKIVPKNELTIKATFKKIQSLEKDIAEESEKIWLI